MANQARFLARVEVILKDLFDLANQGEDEIEVHQRQLLKDTGVEGLLKFMEQHVPEKIMVSPSYTFILPLFLLSILSSNYIQDILGSEHPINLYDVIALESDDSCKIDRLCGIYLIAGLNSTHGKPVVYIGKSHHLEGGIAARIWSHNSPSVRGNTPTKPLYQMLPANQTRALTLFKVKHPDQTMLFVLEGVFVQLFGSLTANASKFWKKRPSYKSLVFTENLIPTNVSVPFREKARLEPCTAEERMMKLREVKTRKQNIRKNKRQKNRTLGHICANCSITDSSLWHPAHDGIGKICSTCQSYVRHHGVNRPRSLIASRNTERIGPCSWSLCGGSESVRWHPNHDDRTQTVCGLCKGYRARFGIYPDTAAIKRRMKPRKDVARKGPCSHCSEEHSRAWCKSRNDKSRVLCHSCYVSEIKGDLPGIKALEHRRTLAARKKAHGRAMMP